ncbi:hypothetical protein V8F33_007743 [Rhypophila sp. PSN 637]
MLQSTTSIFFLLAGVAIALPAATTTAKCEPMILCVDGINECGIRFGNCYDVCNPAAKPTPPPCPPTTKTTTTAAPTTTDKPLGNILLTTTTTPKKTTTTTTSSTKTTSTCNGSGLQVCWDGINACGMMYGGCFADCKPWPTFTPPPCNITTTTTTTTIAPKTTKKPLLF